MKNNRILYIFAILAIGVSTFIRFIWPQILRVTIDSVIGTKPLEVQSGFHSFINDIFNLAGGRSVLVQALWAASLILVVLTLARGIALFLKGRWSAVASENIVKNIREQVYDHLQYLPYQFHVKAKTGDLIQRCTSDMETIRRFIAVQFVEVGRALFMIGFALSFMLQMSVRMTLISMALVPVIFVFAYVFFTKVKKAFKNSDEAEGRMSTVLQENLTGIRVVRAFARQSFELEKFDEKNAEFRDLTYHLIRLLAWYWSVSDLVSLTQIAAVTILGTYWAATGFITLGTMLAFASYVGMLLWPIRQMGRVLTDMGKAMVSINRISEILDEPRETFNSRLKPRKLKGEIEFDNVCFGYEKNKPILHNISFKINKGQTVAILGPTGSGKTSLVHLLPRLYEYQSGSIKIDGMELNTLDKKMIRSNIGIALQEPFLFSKSIKENISLAALKATEEQIHEAAVCSAVHDVIEGFENGYDTEVGEKGVTLSGGQKQRLAIARTIINNTPILIFDDSLSAVDTETDAQIRRELKKRNTRSTTIIISHRLVTLSEADMILVMENGRMMQKGTHEELLAEEGLYKRIWKIQTDLEEELEIEIETEPADELSKLHPAMKTG
ncbi:ABC transporter ATP-binding protein [Candidatus Cloacimonadota bacterium]